MAISMVENGAMRVASRMLRAKSQAELLYGIRSYGSLIKPSSKQRGNSHCNPPIRPRSSDIGRLSPYSRTSRYASTSTTAVTTASINKDAADIAVDPSSLLETSANEWALPFDQLSNSTTAVKPYIGYLKELGIDFGIGPSSIVQWTLEHLQVDLDMPLWTAAIAFTVGLRFLILPLVLDASDCGQRLRALSPRLSPLRKKMSEAMQSQDRMAQAVAVQEIKALQKAAGVKYTALLGPLLVQAPLGFGLFRVTRAMADLPVPGLDAGGISWLYNLTIPDPTYVLPVTTAALMWITLKRGADDQAAPSPGMVGVRQFMVNGLPILTLGAASFMPALTQIGFAAAALFQLIQTELLRLPSVRRALKLHPMVREASEAKEDSTIAYRGTITTAESLGSRDSADQPGPMDRMMQTSGKIMKTMKESANNLKEKAKAAGEKKHSRLSSSELQAAQKYEAGRRKEDSVADERRREREKEQRLKRLQR